MPDKDVKTVKDLIFYQYAKIVARRAYGAEDGKEAKKQSFVYRQKIYSLALRRKKRSSPRWDRWDSKRRPEEIISYLIGQASHRVNLCTPG